MVFCVCVCVGGVYNNCFSFFLNFKQIVIRSENGLVESSLRQHLACLVNSLQLSNSNVRLYNYMRHN